MHSSQMIRILMLSVVVFGVAGLAIPDRSSAAPVPPQLSDSTATTEFNCSFGMDKGEAGQSCQVPIPPGCAVAHFPGTAKPWTGISKGGNTQCRFDDKKTDWKTRITGTCGKCKSGHCSAQFIVKFDCSKR